MSHINPETLYATVANYEIIRILIAYSVKTELTLEGGDVPNA